MNRMAISEHKEQITVVLTEIIVERGANIFTGVRNYERQVEYQFFDADGLAVIGVNGLGEPFHLTGTSSSFSWARSDCAQPGGFYQRQLDEMYLQGWEIGRVEEKPLSLTEAV